MVRVCCDVYYIIPAIRFFWKCQSNFSITLKADLLVVMVCGGGVLLCTADRLSVVTDS